MLIKFMKRVAMGCGILAAVVSTATAGDLTQDLIDSLTTMRSVYGSGYAPANWKKKFAGYDLQENFTNSVEQAKSKANLSQMDTRQILSNFVYAMKDYHVSLSFHSTEEAHLPFSVRGVSGQYFLTYIDRSKLSEEAFPFHIGDELVQFDSRPTQDVVEELKSQFIPNVEETDSALAEINLTRRRASRGYAVPRGVVTLGLIPKGTEKVAYHQMAWDYKPEQIAPRESTLLMNFPENTLNSFGISLSPGSRYNRPMMSVDLGLEDASNPHGIGSRKSFLPSLGLKIWESGPDSIFDAYIFMTESRKLVGYIRIPMYVVEDYLKAVEEFRDVISRFEKTTDGLVIDQHNNPGGSVFYLYSLVSMLADRPMIAPRHRMSITPQDVMSATSILNELKDVKNDEDAKKAIQPEDFSGYPISYEFVNLTREYAHFIIDQWRLGHTLSEPFWLYGVDYINPAPKHYSKPILVLTNELDFSGGDFFPSILQDNKRATIMGARTAGAGGYVRDVEIPNSLGLASFRYTASIAERVDGNPIENLGVVPDVNYSMTTQDYTSDFAPYVLSIQKEVEKLISK